ncbi:MAG: hypothetical protein QM715_03775 [Nibricoccus sp.]
MSLWPKSIASLFIAGLFVSICCGFARANTEVQLEGRFAASDGSFDRGRFKDVRKEVELWDSWQHSDANMGKLRYGPFILEKRFSIYAAGAISNKTVLVAWEDAKTGERISLEPRFGPDNRWVLFHWSPPSNWVGRSVYMIAEDNSADPGQWIGVSAPLDQGLHYEPFVTIGFWYPIVFIVVLLPGFAWTVWRHPKNQLKPESCLTRVLVASSVTGYAVFFVYFASPLVGKISSWAVLLASLGLIIKYWRLKPTDAIKHPVTVPLAICFFTGLLYSTILLAYGGTNSPQLVSMNRYLYTMPPDTILPYWLSERLYAGTTLKPFFSDWLSSDRPPLQAALHLLTAPFVPLRIGYQLMSTALQCWSLLGIWILLRKASIQPRTIAWILFGCVFSGFFLFNSTFVWPKLLPAAFLLISASGLLLKPREPALLTGGCAALAMLGHGGSAFGLAGIIVASLLWPPERRFIYWAKTAAIGIILLLPWTLYQKFYDPPGNRLLKWHLGGVVPVDARPLGQTILDSYRSQPASELLTAKWRNTKMMFYYLDALTENWRAATNLWNQGRRMDAFVRFSYQLREGCFFHLVQSPELFIAGLFGLIAFLFRRTRVMPEFHLAYILTAVFAFGTIAWCLLMFVPGSTTNHQGSYFNNACLFLLSGIGVSALPKLLRWPLACVYVLWFFVVWAYAPPTAMNTTALLTSADPLVLVLGSFATACIVCSLFLLAADRNKGVADNASSSVTTSFSTTSV